VTSAVVIVNWNSGDRLKRCLMSLPADFPVVVVDNASTDDSIAAARSARPQTQFILNSSNRGLSAALNQGFSAASTPWVLILNPDACATPGAVQRLETLLAANPRAGAAGGFVNKKYLPRAVATTSTVVLENLGFPSKPAPSTALSVGQAAAAALLVRREAYAGVGGFDERFVPAWYEDVDFCKRLHDKGWDVLFARDAEFLHEGGYSARALGASGFAEAYYRNQLRYIQKHFGQASALLVRFSIAAGMIARSVAAPSRARACARVLAGALGRW
jgi:GT2 family glycosyltransferase